MHPAPDATGLGGLPIDLGVGEILCEARERHGQELQSVANQLRIRLVYLQAIEDGRFRDLPGSTYAVGFVRSYADYLGLDSADIVRRFREEVAKVHGQTRLIFPSVTAEGKIPGAAVLLLSVLGAVIVYGAWYYASSRQEADLQMIPEVPDRLIALPTGDAAADGSSPALSSAGDATDSAVAEYPPADLTPTQEVIPPDSEELSAEAGVDDAGPAAPTIVVPPTAAAPVVGGGDSESPTITGNPSIAAPASPDAETVAAPPASPAVSVDDDLPPASALVAPAIAEPADRATAADESEPAVPADAGSGPLSPLPAAPAPPIAGATALATPSATANAGIEAALPLTANTVDGAPSAGAAGAIPAAPPPPAPVLEPETPAQQAARPASGGPRIVLEARMETWIRIVDSAGARVIETTLRPGERYEVPDQAGLSLKTGNAGGLDVLVDGAKAPPLGEVGSVIDRIALDPDRLRSGTVLSN